MDILRLNKISPVIDGIFDEKYNLTDESADPAGIILRSFNMADYEVGGGLVAIGRAGAGVNNIPIEKMAEKGVVVFNTPGANANAVKELVLCGMLIASRDIIGGNRWVNTLTSDVAKATEKGKAAFGGREIFGKTMGVIGLGAIGVLVANACVALGLEVMGYDPFLSEEARSRLGGIEIVSLEEIYRRSDIITMHVPLSEGTKGMINAGTLDKMRDGVIILNMSRGALVDVPAIKDAIACGRVAKYVVDFPDENVVNSEGIIVLPHLGASTEEAEDNCAKMAAEELKVYIEDGNIINSVNFPGLVKERRGAVRTCVCFRAEAKSAVEALPGDKKVAVRGSYGYAIVDGDTAADLTGVDGVLRVRVL